MLSMSQMTGFNVVSGDPYWGDVVFLSHFENISGIYAVVDEIGHNIVNAPSDYSLTSSYKKYGSTSLQATTNPTYSNDVAITQSNDYVLGSGDITIEAWLFINDFTGDKAIWFPTIDSNVTGLFAVEANSGKAMVWNGYAYIKSTNPVPLNEWFFVASVRESGTVSIYINGTRVINGTVSKSFSSNTYALMSGPIGGRIYIDELRVTKRARYSGATCQVPTAPFPNS